MLVCLMNEILWIPYYTLTFYTSISTLPISTNTQILTACCKSDECSTASVAYGDYITQYKKLISAEERTWHEKIVSLIKDGILIMLLWELATIYTSVIKINQIDWQMVYSDDGEIINNHDVLFLAEDKKIVAKKYCRLFFFACRVNSVHKGDWGLGERA